MGCGPWSQRGLLLRAPMLGGSWSEHPATSTSLRSKAASLVCPIGFVIPRAATMAIATQKEHHMQQPPPHPPDKERPLLPHINDGGIQARFGEQNNESDLS